MKRDIDYFADNYVQEYGRESIAAAFQHAAKCLENQDFAGYEHHFQVYVCLVQRSGFTRELSQCHRDASSHANDVHAVLAAVNPRQSMPLEAASANE